MTVKALLFRAPNPGIYHMTIHKLLMLGATAIALRLVRPFIGIRRQEWSVPHSTTVTVTSSVRFLRLVALLAACLASLSGASAASAAACTQRSNPIETDRPDTTNSSVGVPVGSFQYETGINLNRHDSALVFDGTNSRLRLGIAPCLE